MSHASAMRLASICLALIAAPPVLAQQRIVFGGDGVARAAPGSAPVHFTFDGATPQANAKGAQSDGPFLLSIDAAPGNYRVTVTLGGPKPSLTTIKAELRRLMLNNIAVPAGGSRQVSFVVNVRTPAIAGGGAVRLKGPRETTQEAVAWDKRLTLEFNGMNPAVRAIEVTPVQVPTIYLLGDSTVCDQPGEPYASWGQMLTAMFQPVVAISNQGESGESVSASNSRGRFTKILGDIRPGDVFVVQFGHNDMKERARDPQAPIKYRDGLIAWAKAVQAKGATAVIVSPMNRHTFKDGKIVNSLEEYPDLARAAAQASGAKFIDLNGLSKTLYDAFGDVPSLELFKHDADGSNRDMTHHSPFGAYELARIVTTELARVEPRLARMVRPEYRRFDPARPDQPAAVVVPSSPTPPAPRPLGDDEYAATPPVAR